ncbi:MAG: glucose-6-phosphate isomerase [Erysipelotrichaceae bacterium]
MINFNIDKTKLNETYKDYQSDVTRIHNNLNNHTGIGHEYDGWLNFTISDDEVEHIINTADRIKNSCDVFLICGIGGSYLGAKGAIDMINGLYNDLKPEIIPIGNTFSSNYIVQVLNHIKDKDVCVNVISKSGTTAETAVAFRLIKNFMHNKYSDNECSKRIIVSTDEHLGTLNVQAKEYGYEQFNIPNNLGGRYSMMSCVGLLPMAVASIDIKQFLKGYRMAQAAFSSDIIEENAAYQYAVVRRMLEKQGNEIELLVAYETQMAYFCEWWKQLFAESEGKNGKGIFPACANFSADLHSIGQFIQDGKHVLYETLLLVKKPTYDMEFPYDKNNLDEMNYVANKSLDYINKMTQRGTYTAHTQDANVFNIIIEIEDMSAYSIGYLIYFFFKAVAMSVYLIDENPFDQPGVEVYKHHMFELLKDKS